VRRRGLRTTWLLGALVALSAPASAEKLVFDGFIELAFANLGKIVADATGTGVATVNGSGGTGHLTTLRIDEPFADLQTTIPVTDPIVTNGGILTVIYDIEAAPQVQGGVFAPISGAVQSTTALSADANTMPSLGQARICLFNPGCVTSLDVDLGETVNGEFVGIGVGGLLTIGGVGNIRVSIVGAPWTVKTVSVSNRTNLADITTFARHGFAHGPSSGTSSTALTSGVVQLVTANQIRTIGIPGNGDASGIAYSMRLHFIPEPGLLLLLGSGAMGLLVLGRMRRRR
jgi:hypothetical protein